MTLESSCSKLSFHQDCRKYPTVPLPHQHGYCEIFLSMCTNIMVNNGVKVLFTLLDYYWRWTSFFFFTCILIVCIFSSINCLFISFANFSTGLFVFLLLFSKFLYILYLHVLQISFSSLKLTHKLQFSLCIFVLQKF